jgi:hypothetical protein
MYCPSCGAEYREGFDACVECSTPLVESLPEQAEPEVEAFVTIANYRDLPEALVAQAALRGAGILSVLANYYLIAIEWRYSVAVHGLPLRVSASDAVDATLVLDVANSPTPPELPSTVEWRVTEAACPDCGSTDIGSVDTLRQTGALFMLLPSLLLFWYGRLPVYVVTQWIFFLGAVVPVAIRRRRWRCRRCSRTWRSEPSIDVEGAAEPYRAPLPREALLWLLWIGFALIALAMLRAYARQG